MTSEAILDAFTRLLRDLLSDDTIVLTMATRRDDVLNWDSLGYVTFIAAAEMDHRRGAGVSGGVLGAGVLAVDAERVLGMQTGDDPAVLLLGHVLLIAQVLEVGFHFGFGEEGGEHRRREDKPVLRQTGRAVLVRHRGMALLARIDFQD